MSKQQNSKEKFFEKQLKHFNTSITSNQITKAEKFLNLDQIYLIEIIGCCETSVLLKGYDNNINEDKNLFNLVTVKLIMNQNIYQIREIEDDIMNLLKIKSPYVNNNTNYYYDEKYCCFMIVMKYCEKGDLQSYLQNNQRLAKSKITNIFIQILQGLQDIHKQGIIHSNLNPNNILITDSDTPYIIGLGQQKVLQEYKQLESNNNNLYQPVEQLEGIVRKENDYYAAGLILCFLCGLQIDDTLQMQLRNGEFPDIQNYKNKKLIKIGFQMMEKYLQKRINLNNAMKKIQILNIYYQEYSYSEQQQDFQSNNVKLTNF